MRLLDEEEEDDDEFEHIPEKVRAACACPVDWKGLVGFGSYANSALDTLSAEWVRCFSRHAIAEQDLYLFIQATQSPTQYRTQSDEDAVVENILLRRPSAEIAYMQGIGRLHRLRFLRPSEHGKHFSVSGPKSTGTKISFFYKDAQQETLATIFWDWFDETFVLAADHHSDAYNDNLSFTWAPAELWERLRSGRDLRLAVSTVDAIGELNGQPLRHLALDLDFQTGTAHAYPIQEQEANSIMGDIGVRNHRPIENLTK